MVAFFAFDLGYEISLEGVQALIASTPLQPISRKKRTPTYLQYSNPPQVLILGEIGPLETRTGQITATLFDFGAVSIGYRWPLEETPMSKMPVLSQHLHSLDLEAHAKLQAESLIEKLSSAITRPHLAPLIEDYYIFVLDRIQPSLSSHELLEQYRASIAQVLRFEDQPLSTTQREEALQEQVSYYEDDLAIMDWNAALIYDRDYSDTISVLELLNIELLEARYIDARLDRVIDDYEGLVKRRPLLPIPLRTPYQSVINNLAELRIESALLSERVDNSLKLIGDLYLARVHTAAGRRFYLQDWQTSISRKLDIIEDLYRLLTDRVNTAQGQALELVVILLILIEIILAVVREWH
ncbi:hypothetical protein H6F94_10340 [Leptolyngbya sp. FACHB-261]|nr:hypothetical protein [Leptolyngbya sp. FACHB-261]